MSRPVYFDYASTTPVDPVVVDAMLCCLSQEGTFGNASSDSHDHGLAAQYRIAEEREKVAGFLNAEPEAIIWTSGATESNNLAILGIARANQKRGRHIMTSSIEHKSVLEACHQLEKEGFELTILQPNSKGIISCESLQKALRSDTILVSMMMVNNEIGTIQPIAAMGELLKTHPAYFHVDAVQAVGKMPIDVQELQVDALTLSAHKMYGPKGSGILYCRRQPRVPLAPLFFGGGQESKMRPGTLATHQIVGFSTAFEIAERNRASEVQKLAQQKERLWQGLQSLEGVMVNGDFHQAVPHILNISFEGVDGEALMSALSGFSLSSGSACTSGSIEPSHVLQAIGQTAVLAHSAIRFSFGRYTTDADIDALLQALIKEVMHLRSLSPLWKKNAAEPFGFNADLKPVQRWDNTSGCILTATKGSLSAGEVITIHLLIHDHTIQDTCFLAHGSASTIQACAALCRELIGQPLEVLTHFDKAAWAEKLQLPREKYHALLLIEEVLLDLYKNAQKPAV